MSLQFLGMAVVREATRLGRLDMEALAARHADATEVGGFVCFAAFLVINGGLLAYCIKLVRSGGKASPPPAEQPATG